MRVSLGGENRPRARRGCTLRVEIDPDSDEPSPYVLVRSGLEALIARAVFYDLVELAGEEERDGERQFGVWSDGVFFPLGNPGEIVD